MMPFFGGGIPMIIREQGNQQRPDRRHADSPPVRCEMAMEFIRQMAALGLERAAATENQIERLKGHTQSGGEESAVMAAAHCLEQYFEGKLQPNVWEQADLALTPTAEMDCMCRNQNTGQPAANCPFCAGSGKMDIMLNGADFKYKASQEAFKKLGDIVDEQEGGGTPPPPKKPRGGPR
jgi:hypothetical protein